MLDLFIRFLIAFVSLLMSTLITPASAATPALAFLSDAERVRLNDLSRTQALFEGRHRDYFLAGGRTQHRFAPEIIDGATVKRYLSVNVVGMAARKIADMVCLQTPIIAAPAGLAGTGQADAIARIDRDSGFAAALYEAVLKSGYQGEAWWQVYVRDDLGTPTGGACIANVAAEQVFPDTSTIKPNGTFGRVVKQWIVPAPGTGGKVRLLRREVHEAGRVSNELWRLSDKGAIGERVALSLTPETAGLPDEQATGVQAPLIQIVPNFMLAGRCVSDLDGADTLIDQINATATQIARVIAKHADPKLGVPADLMDEEGNVRASDDLFAFHNKDETPFYLVWNAQLEFSFKLLDWSMRTYLMLQEVSPSLIGLGDNAKADAWKKVRLEAAPTLAKVARRIIYLDRAVKDIWLAAHAAENAMVPGLRYDYGEPDVTWRDGLPVDEDTQATTHSILKSSGLISTAQAVLERVGDPDQAAAEVAQIQVEREAATDVYSRDGGQRLGAAG